jgi:hypothetical protein
VSATQTASSAPSDEGELEPALSGESGPLLRREDPRRLGDLLVYRFERAGRAPLLLTEKVDAQSSETTEMIVILSEGERHETLRVVLSRLSERVLSVTKDNAERSPLPLAAYDKLLTKTAFLPEENIGLVQEKQETCLVGAAEASCETKKYRVIAAGSEANFTLQRSAGLGRDVLGEVVTDDGVILYRANLIEAVRGPELVPEKTAQALRERTVRESYLSGEQL